MKKTTETKTPLPGTPYKRRDFLVLGSAGLLAPLAVGANPLAPSPEWVAPAGEGSRTESRAASVGYWAASPGLVDLEQDAALASVDEALTTRVVPADRLRADSGLIRAGTRLRLQGLVEPPEALLRPRLERLSAKVEFRVPIQGRIATLKVHAWSRGPLDETSSVGLNVPVDRAGGLKISFDCRDGHLGLSGRLVRQALTGTAPPADRAHASEVWFTTGAEAGKPKLRRGVYFVAIPGHDRGPAPAWQRYEFRATPKEDGPRRLVERTPLGFQPVDFHYMIVSVDRADTTGSPV
jgi:hypothetical protein